MPRKKYVPPAPIVMKFYLHYDKDTGILKSISNDVSYHGYSNFEISAGDYKLFIEGVKRPQDYLILSNNDEITLVKVIDQSYEFKNKMFEWINMPPTTDTEVTVEWIKSTRHWKFSLSDSAKSSVLPDSNTVILFFITLADDFDFLIRSIALNINELAIKDLYVPFRYDIEDQIAKISMSTKLHFKSYGLIIND
jgi:hypothetical protein